MKRTWLPIIWLPLLSSCSWFSTPATPAVTTPAQFNSLTAEYSPTESLPYLAWWQQFHDPELSSLIESGIKANLDLKIATSNLEQATAQLKQIQLSWLPSINLLGGYSSNPALGTLGSFYGIMPQYTLNIFKLIQEQKLAKYNLAMQQAMLDGVRLSIIGQISASYISFLGNQQQLRLLQQLAADSKELIKLSQAELKIGLSDQIEISTLMANYEQIQAQINQVEHNLVVSQNALHYLLNQNPGPLTTKVQFTNYDFSHIKPGALPASVLNNRPDLLIAQIKLKASYAQVGLAQSNLFPAIKLDTFVGASAGDNQLAAPTNYTTLSDAYLNWGINPAVIGQIEAQQGAYQAETYAYIKTVRKILAEVDNDYSANSKARSSYISLYQAYQDYAHKYQLQQGLYHNGLLARPELLKSKLVLDNFALSANLAKLQEGMSLVNLYQSLAGGYKFESAPHANSASAAKRNS